MSNNIKVREIADTVQEILLCNWDAGRNKALVRKYQTHWGIGVMNLDSLFR